MTVAEAVPAASGTLVIGRGRENALDNRCTPLTSIISKSREHRQANEICARRIFARRSAKRCNRGKLKLKQFEICSLYVLNRLDVV